MSQNPSTPLSRLFVYARKIRNRIYLASTYSALNKLFDLAPPFLIGLAVDIVVERKGSYIARFGIEDVSHQLYVLAVITVIIWGLESLFEYAFAIEWRNIAQNLQHNLRQDAYAHMQKLELSYFEKQSTGDLMAVLNDDVNQMERFLNGGANSIIQVATTVLVVGGTFFYFAPYVALFAFLPIPIILFGSFWYQKKLFPRYFKMRNAAANLNSSLNNNISGIATVKSYVAEKFEEQRISELSQEYAETNRQAIQLSSAFSPLIRMAIVVGFIATIVLGGNLTLAGQLEVGIFSMLVYITQRLLWPLTRLGETFDLYQRAMASTRRIFDLIDTPINIKEGHSKLASPIEGRVSFDKLHFQYDRREPLIKGLSLSVKPGQTVAIVGSTGSGKSTLVKLLLRYYEPQQGVILLDGQPIDQLQFSSLRGAIGLVSQDVFLFDGTVIENIRYGQNHKSLEEVQRASKLAEAHDFIMGLPEAYDTVIGERGVLLSGGQRQRISLARAILKDPPILVLDEATSSVDNETEAAIQRSLDKVTVDRTTIVIAHRLSTVRNADRIYVLERGQLVESGQHDELIQSNGLYAKLWRVQTGVRLTTSL